MSTAGADPTQPERFEFSAETLAAAKTEIAKARAVAKLPQHKAMVERLDRVARHVGEFARQLEVNVFFNAVERFDGHGPAFAQPFDGFLHERFRRRSARGDPDLGDAVKPDRIKHGRIFDEIARDAEILADLAQPVRV